MNRDWQKLKKSANGVPTNDSLLPYVLEAIKEGGEFHKKTIIKRVVEFLQIPEDLLEENYPDTPHKDSILIDRFGWALSSLYISGLVKRPRRGVYKITESGLAMLDKHGDKLTKKMLEDLPAFKEYKKELDIRNERTGNKISIPEAEEKEIQVESIINNQNNEVAIELLNKVRQVEPSFFEKLVVDLLVAMGYSGKNGDAKVTTQSNDGGIDGIINQDPLGTSTVYIQAKRYKDGNTVGRPAIQSFYGALAGVNADRGVFITTSNFAKGAQDFAKSQGIVLIDGIKLTDLMMQYGVGIEVAKVYKQFRIDSDYFEEDMI